MSEQKGYLIIDIGTGNVRVAITDQAGNVLHVERDNVHYVKMNYILMPFILIPINCGVK